MTILNSEKAVIDIEKLRDYCLNPEHPRGKHKAKVFKSVLNFDQNNIITLKNILLDGIKNNEAVFKNEDQFGKRFIVDIKM